MLLPIVLLAALHTTPAVAAAHSADDSLSGAWHITGDVMGNPLDETCTLKQTGATLGGSCTGQAGEKTDVSGEIKDGKVVFKHGGDYQGQALTITYTATAASATQLKGSVDVQPFGVTGSFTATPAPAKP